MWVVCAGSQVCVELEGCFFLFHCDDQGLLVGHVGGWLNVDYVLGYLQVGDATLDTLESTAARLDGLELLLVADLLLREGRKYLSHARRVHLLGELSVELGGGLFFAYGEVQHVVNGIPLVHRPSPPMRRL